MADIDIRSVAGGSARSERSLCLLKRLEKPGREG